MVASSPTLPTNTSKLSTKEQCQTLKVRGLTFAAMKVWKRWHRQESTSKKQSATVLSYHVPSSTSSVTIKKQSNLLSSCTGLVPFRETTHCSRERNLSDLSAKASLSSSRSRTMRLVPACAKASSISITKNSCKVCCILSHHPPMAVLWMNQWFKT